MMNEYMMLMVLELGLYNLRVGHELVYGIWNGKREIPWYRGDC